VILSAGKGSRLYPHTEQVPKCLLELSGRTLLEWQLDALHDSGIREMSVVTGFGHERVERVVAARGDDRGKVELHFNPFFQVADNLGSVWIARERWSDDTLLLNGDTLVPPVLIKGVMEDAACPITVAVDTKESYDADDMKVLQQDGRLLRIGKAITDFNAESIGLLAFRREGRKLFIDAVQRTMATPDGVRVWYLSVIDDLTASGRVGTTQVATSDWQEVDYVADLDAARALTAKWVVQGS
jgi:choline kinase